MTDISPREELAEPSTSASIAHNSVRTFVARTIVLALTVATGIAIAKGLGPVGKGVYSGTLMLVSLVMVGPAGIAGAIIYALTKQRRSLADILPASGVLLVTLTLLSGLGALVFSLLRGWNPVLTIFVTAVPPSVVLAWQGGFYIGLGRLRNLNTQSIGVALATLVGVTLAIFALHGGAIAALVAWLLCLYGAAAVVLWHVVALGRGPSRVPLGPTTAGLIRFGGQAAVNLFLGQVNYRIDSIILIALLGTAPFGIYSLAVNFGEMLFMLTRPITAAATRDIGIRSHSSSAIITAKVIRLCTAMVAAASMVAFVGGPLVIDTVYGARFASAAAPLRILLPGIVAFSTAGTFAAFFIMQMGRPLIVSVVNLVMIAIQALMCIAFVPRLGMSGAALASTITYVSGALMNTWWFCRTTGVSPLEVWVVRRDDLEMIRGVVAQVFRRAPAQAVGEGTAGAHSGLG